MHVYILNIKLFDIITIIVNIFLLCEKEKEIILLLAFIMYYD